MEKNEQICFTIGHSDHTIENFIKLIKVREISNLIDIRSIPYSQYTKQFNKEELAKKIIENELKYRYLGNMVGGGLIRFQKSSHNTPMFKEFQENEKFQKGISILHKFILKNKLIVLMCSEKDPFVCHRFFLVSYFLQKRGVEIYHILYNGDIIKNKDLEKKIKASNAQRSLFDFQKNWSREELYEKHCQYIIKKYSEEK
jgi:uncharacterized protein (DUF488 family)